MSDTGPIDPASLSLADLRAERSALQDADDVVSYVRRAAQARLDLARAEAALGLIADGHPDARTLAALGLNLSPQP